MILSRVIEYVSKLSHMSQAKNHYSKINYLHFELYTINTIHINHPVCLARISYTKAL